MSIAGVMNAGVTGLLANQQALRGTSTNIANLNTPGYVRQETQFQALSTSGNTTGVEAITRRAADRFLAAASLRASSEAGAASARSGLLDRAQATYGDPNSDASVFGALDRTFASFSSLSLDPRSAVRQADTVSALRGLMAEVNRAGGEIAALRSEADASLDGEVAEVNTLLGEVARLNRDIQTGLGQRADVSGAEAQLSQALDALAEFVDIRAEPRELGGVNIRTTSGLLLVGHEAGRISRDTSRAVDGFGGLTFTPAGGAAAEPLERSLRGGSLLGLITARDSDLVGMGEELGALAAGIADALNATHAGTTAVPAPSTLQGRDTGLLGTDSLNFTGTSRVAVVDAQGRTVRTVTLSFGAPPTRAVDGGAPVAFTPTVQGMADTLNTALAGVGSASFANGRLSVSASGGNGIALADDPANPSARAGRSLAHHFGLNDILTSAEPLFYETGLSRSDAHGFAPGQAITFAIRDEAGAVARTVAVTPTGTTWADLETQLAGTDVLGAYAVVQFNDATGQLQITPRPGTGGVDVANDTTARGGAGMSLSTLMGLSASGRADRATGVSVPSDILNGTRRIGTALAELASTTLPGSLAVAPGDARGATALSNAASRAQSFPPSGSLASASTTLEDYAGRIAGAAGRRAAAAERAATSAESFATEARTRRQGAEGVNLDEEMVNLTTFQQAYSASARVIQAANDLYDTLLRLV
jgi:flagellar hook-associated protein 1 FlgK